MTTFSGWLEREMAERRMSPADLARATRKDQGVISRILSGERSPSPNTLSAIAHALRLPVETVLRAAGILPPVEDATELLEQIKADVADCTPEEQAEILAYIRMKRELREKKKGPPK
jgi:transcriptional regulator with XRE-family HTH domain